MLNILPSLIFIFQPTPVKVKVENLSSIKKVESRDVTFGVKETVEELISSKGYNPVSDTSEGFDLQVHIDSIYSPQQVLNIFGLKWLRKDYVVESSICLGTKCVKAKAVRKTFIFAALLDIENNEIPLNRKSFSKALESSLKECTENLTK
jgi:hypothetical protein